MAKKEATPAPKNVPSHGVFVVDGEGEKAYLPIPTKPPLCSDLIAPPDSEMISPPGAGALLAV